MQQFSNDAVSWGLVGGEPRTRRPGSRIRYERLSPACPEEPTRTEYAGHIWAYGFVEGRTHDRRKFRIRSIIDEFSRECLALVVARKLNHEDVLAALARLFSGGDHSPI